MAISATRHHLAPRGDALAEQAGDAIAVADGATAPVPATGYYRLIATSPCRLRIGMEIENATGGEYWPEGSEGVRSLVRGQTIAVDALA